MAEPEDIVLGSAVANIPYIKVFDEMVRDRYNQMDLTPLVTYLVDFCPSESLYWLALQFDVVSAGEFDLCTTDQDKRNLIKQAIPLHRKMGTPWAIRNALLSLGFANVVIQEGGTAAIYDGTYNYNGAIHYDGGANSWADFRIQILDLGETKGWSDLINSNVLNVINKYKRLVCVLQGINLVANVSDTEEAGNETEDLAFELIFEAWQETVKNFGIIYDGEFDYDGTQVYGGDAEIFLFNMTPLLDAVPAPNIFPGYGDFVTTGGFVNVAFWGLEFVATSSGYIPFDFRAGLTYNINFFGGSASGRGTFTMTIGDNTFDLTPFTNYNITIEMDSAASSISWSFRVNSGDTAWIEGLTISLAPTEGLDILGEDDSNFTVNIVYSSDPTLFGEDGEELLNEDGSPINSE